VDRRVETATLHPGSLAHPGGRHDRLAPVALNATVPCVDNGIARPCTEAKAPDRLPDAVTSVTSLPVAGLYPETS